MQFQIPQFIEIEDKIAGPFSLRQLLFVVGGGIITFLAFTMLPFFGALVIGLIALGGSLSLALVKVNGQPLTRIAFAAAGFFWKPRLYLWKREAKERTFEVPEFAGLDAPSAPEKIITEQHETPKKMPMEVDLAETHARREEQIVAHLDASERETLIRQKAIDRSVAIQKELSEGPVKHEKISDEHIIDQRSILKKFSAGMPSINKLASDLNTTKNPIPKREKAIPAVVAEQFNTFRKKTGERQVAKRVDFR